MEETPESKSMDLDTHTTATDEVMNGNDHEGGEAMPDDQSPSSTSSDSDSNDDEEDEAQQNLQIQALETELSNNPSNYDAHVQYIKLLRKMSEIEKLREAREAMSALFPLTPEMWQEWAKDEASLATGIEALPVIEKLYEQGVSEYLSVSLWCEYITFIQEFDPSVRECSAAGILKARNLFERALTSTGLHVAEGSKIWEMYRKFEQAIFCTIHDINSEEKEKQIQRIRSIFHRQLSIPLADLRSTLLAYKTWEAEQGKILDANGSDLDGVSRHVASAYHKALEMYNTRVHFEELISRQDTSGTERLQQFMNYLKFEQSHGDPARVQILYERAITVFPISSDLWLDYTRYLDRTLKGTIVVWDVYSRATRNCPWFGELWVRYLLSLERGHSSEKDISTVFSKSLQCTFSSFEEYLDLFLTRIDGLRRRISLAGEADDLLNYALIKDTFQHGSDYLSPQLKNSEGLLRLHAYWARLELNLGKDLLAARGVWESLLKISGSTLEAWQGYIAMEIELGHVNEARSIYKRCYSKRFPGMGSEDICNSWLRFEREFGSLEEFDHAIQKVTPRLEELQFYRLQQESKGAAGSTEEIQNSNRKHEKRKPDSNVSNEQPLAKRRKDAAENQKKEYRKDKPQGQKSVESSKAYGIKAQDNVPESLKEQEIKHSNLGKNKQFTDQCTAFVSNLNVKANHEHLRDFFKDVGGVVDIRILKDKYTGNSRGLAYIDFSDEAQLAAAVAKNRQSLLGKKLSIARSDPNQRRKKESSGQRIPVEHGIDNSGSRSDRIGSVSQEAVGMSKESRASEGPSSIRRHGDDNIQLKGRNTFAVPRNVRPLGWKVNKGIGEDGEDEKPKSNDEFRKMFLKR